MAVVSLDDTKKETGEKTQNTNEDELYIGKKFEIHDDLFGAYKAYAKREGFVVRKRNNRKNEEGIIRSVTYVCNRPGNSVNKTKNIAKPRKSNRCDCKAYVTARLDDEDKWEISQLKLDHNHTYNPSLSRHYRQHRKVEPHVLRTIDLNDQSGIPMEKTFRSVIAYEVVDFDEVSEVHKYVIREDIWLDNDFCKKVKFNVTFRKIETDDDSSEEEDGDIAVQVVDDGEGMVDLETDNKSGTNDSETNGSETESSDTDGSEKEECVFDKRTDETEAAEAKKTKNQLILMSALQSNVSKVQRFSDEQSKVVNKWLDNRIEELKAKSIELEKTKMNAEDQGDTSAPSYRDPAKKKRRGRKRTKRLKANRSLKRTKTKPSQSAANPTPSNPHDISHQQLSEATRG
ncbi:hypothetical protein MKW92_049660 [Papaver armeniacum]|nr:hypothetical protein MKW92_049660 [Papaver armeniacum]